MALSQFFIRELMFLSLRIYPRFLRRRPLQFGRSRQKHMPFFKQKVEHRPGFRLQQTDAAPVLPRIWNESGVSSLVCVNRISMEIRLIRIMLDFFSST
jgi:hypothetical protein